MRPRSICAVKSMHTTVQGLPGAVKLAGSCASEIWLHGTVDVALHVNSVMRYFPACLE